MADKDTQLDLKKRARRRLVGAVTLATAAAILLPFVMEQEPKPVGQDIQIRIPSQNVEPKRPDASPGREAPAPMSEPAINPVGPPPTRPDPVKPVDEAKATQETREPVAGSGLGGAASDAKAVKAPNKPTENSVEKSSEKSTQKAETKHDKQPDSKAEAKSAARREEARVHAILDGGEQYVVQLGSFKDPANAKKIREKVKAEGYNSFTEVVSASDGSTTRVRAGPFSSREAAEKAREKLKRIGLDGIVAGKS